jgi:hypothetical protein
MTIVLDLDRVEIGGDLTAQAERFRGGGRDTRGL